MRRGAARSARSTSRRGCRARRRLRPGRAPRPPPRTPDRRATPGVSGSRESVSRRRRSRSAWPPYPLERNPVSRGRPCRDCRGLDECACLRFDAAKSPSCARAPNVKGIAEILRDLGEPPAVPFAPAPFQQAALDALGRGDVLVSAPTGSGKTWIAEQEIARLVGLAAVGAPRVWYTTPLKALSNQKFRRFQAMYGEDRVGLLTGERRLNARAPVVVATTEILRNALYGEDRTIPDVVVLDEAHYLADPERGTAWEEILLLAAPATRLLLLSATIPNAAQLADWMATVRGRRPEVITLEIRPVPLEYLLADGDGRLHPPDPARIRTRRRHPQWLATITDGLVRHRLTPAILFFPSRRECDDSARRLG